MTPRRQPRASRNVKYHPEITSCLTAALPRGGTVLIGQFDWGGLLPNGNGGVPRYPRPGRQSGNASAKVQGCLTARAIARAGTKVGFSDPAVLDGKAVAQQIKGTPGITG